MTNSPAPAPHPIPAFDPVAVRARHDGWTPDRQVAFIEALGECGCVVDACRRVGLSGESAYGLRRRPDAQSFRMAWDAALDYAVRRLSDAAFSRAIHGVAVPYYYKGELVGEHRRYDEKLTQFLLRYRDPVRYGRARDTLLAVDDRVGELQALELARFTISAKEDAEERAAGGTTPPRTVEAIELPVIERPQAPAEEPGSDPDVP